MRPITYVLIGKLNAQKTSRVRKSGQFSDLKSIPFDTRTQLRAATIKMGWIGVIEKTKSLSDRWKWRQLHKTHHIKTFCKLLYYYYYFLLCNIVISSIGITNFQQDFLLHYAPLGFYFNTYERRPVQEFFFFALLGEEYATGCCESLASKVWLEY